jgi:ABC-2 type transport system ATP-binding protein
MTPPTSLDLDPRAVSAPATTREPDPEDHVITVSGLTKTYGSAVAVDRLTFTVRAGSVTAFLGPNGAGKTTTIRMVLGLVRPDEGSASVFGVPFPSLERPMSRVGVMIDGAAFHPRRTGRNHLRVLAAAAGLRRDRVAQVLAAVDLESAADRPVGGYSLGMRQRLGLAAALLGEPELLILDEPANGLDPAGTRWLRGFLREFTASGGAVLLSSHLLAEVALLADDVVVIDGGRLLTQTTVAQLTAGSTVVLRSPGAVSLRGAISARGGTIQDVDADRLVVSGLAADILGDLVFGAGFPVHELTETHHSLEEAFLDITKGHSDARTPES